MPENDKCASVCGVVIRNSDPYISICCFIFNRGLEFIWSNICEWQLRYCSDRVSILNLIFFSLFDVIALFVIVV